MLISSNKDIFFIGIKKITSTKTFYGFKISKSKSGTSKLCNFTQIYLCNIKQIVMYYRKFPPLKLTTELRIEKIIQKIIINDQQPEIANNKKMRKFEKGAQQPRNLEVYDAPLQPHLKQIPKLKLNRQNIIKKNNIELTQKYIYGDKIGQGSFGEVYKVVHKQLGVTRALKIIDKVGSDGGKYDTYEELEILKRLDHPNVLKVYEYFETELHWFIITEFFQGKELFEQIITQQRLTQHKSALIFSQICKAVSYIHSHSIAHRDIKPENILIRKHKFQSPISPPQQEHQIEYEYEIKLIDWGLGCRSVKEMIRKCGTPQYCAPEVLSGKYGLECDIWSLGILLYVMLAGRFPFKGRTVQQTLFLVSQAKLDFKSPQWQCISIQAKYLISCLIRKQPNKRLSATQILKSEWLLYHLQQSKSYKSPSTLQLEQNSLKQTLLQLKQLTIKNKLHAVVLNLIHNFITTEQKQRRLKKQFEQLDQNKDGVLSYKQLLEGYRKVYPYFTQQKLQAVVGEIFRNVDLDGSGEIQYSQFVTFATRVCKKFSFMELEEVFRLLDQNGDGRINRKEIYMIFLYEKGMRNEEFEKIVDEIDVDGDGSISIQQFVNNINKAVQCVIRKNRRLSSKDKSRSKQKKQNQVTEQGRTSLCRVTRRSIKKQNQSTSKTKESIKQQSMSREQKQNESQQSQLSKNEKQKNQVNKGSRENKKSKSKSRDNKKSKESRNKSKSVNKSKNY